MRTTISLLWMQAILPLVAISIVSQHTPLWESRYFRFSHISLLICLAMSAWTISQQAKVRVVLCVVALSISLTGSIAFWDWKDLPNRQAVKGAMQMIDKSDGSDNANKGNAGTAVIVCAPMDFIIARYYARQLQWPDARVRLWTGSERLPGAAAHLLSDTDWWVPDPEGNPDEPIWILWGNKAPINAADLVPLGEREFEFPSDTHLGEWTVYAARITKERLLSGVH